jgi:hypothetical protein
MKKQSKKESGGEKGAAAASSGDNKKSKRALTRVPTEVTVNKKLRDSFGSLTEAERTQNVFEGKTLPQRLTVDVHQKNVGGDPGFGASYNKDRVAEYKDKHSNRQQLKVADESQDMGVEVKAAIAGVRKGKPDWGPMLHYCKRGDVPNQKELVEWGKILFECSNQNVMHVSVMMEALKALTRWDIRTRFPTELALLHPTLDLFCTTQFNKHARKRMASNFITLNRNMVAPVMDLSNYDAVEAGDNVETVMKEMNMLLSESKLARAALADKIETAIGKQLYTAMMNEVSKLDGKPINEDAVKTTLDNMKQAGQAVKNKHLLPKKRSILFTFRGREYRVPVDSEFELAEALLWAYIKTRLVTNDQAKSCAFEDQVCRTPRGKFDKNLEVSSGIIAAQELARDNLEELITKPGWSTGKELQKRLEASRVDLEGLEGFLKIEIQVFIESCGVAGSEFLREEMLDLCPKPGVPFVVSETVEHLGKMQESRLAKISTTEAKQELKSVKECFGQIEKKKPPQVHALNNSAFCAKVVQSLDNLVDAKKTDEEGTETVVYGAEAMTILGNAVLKKDADGEEVDPRELTVFARFFWLTNHDTKIKVDALSKKIVEMKFAGANLFMGQDEDADMEL